MRLQYKDVEINITKELKEVIGNDYRLVSIRPFYEYKDGVRLSTISGYSYEIVLLDRGYEKIGVKVLGMDLIGNDISEEELIKGVRVSFSKLAPKVFAKASNDFVSFNLSLTAESVFITNDKKVTA